MDRLEVAIERLCGLVEVLRSELALLRPSSPPTVVDADGVARMLGVGERTLRRLRATRNFPRPISGPGPLRWRRRDIERWLEGGR